MHRQPLKVNEATNMVKGAKVLLQVPSARTPSLLVSYIGQQCSLVETQRTTTVGEKRWVGQQSPRN